MARGRINFSQDAIGRAYPYRYLFIIVSTALIIIGPLVWVVSPMMLRNSSNGGGGNPFFMLFFLMIICWLCIVAGCSGMQLGCLALSYNPNHPTVQWVPQGQVISINPMPGDTANQPAANVVTMTAGGCSMTATVFVPLVPGDMTMGRSTNLKPLYPQQQFVAVPPPPPEEQIHDYSPHYHQASSSNAIRQGSDEPPPKYEDVTN